MKWKLKIPQMSHGKAPLCLIEGITYHFRDAPVTSGTPALLVLRFPGHSHLGERHSSLKVFTIRLLLHRTLC